MTTLTLVGIGRVDGVVVGPQANFARVHLCDGGADRSVCANVRVEYRLPWPHPEPKKLSTVLGFSQAVSHSSLIARRMMDLVVAVSVRRESASGGRSVFAPVLGLVLVASFAACSAASLPGTPTCAGIHRNCICHPWLRSASSD
ncbi:hypothetical protein IFM51744_11011 [Aspergillus udagawae]|nr:hypothetical protein IFM51744_11011 [Aspergillus udagawae]